MHRTSTGIYLLYQSMLDIYRIPMLLSIAIYCYLLLSIAIYQNHLEYLS
jgi:hypothetical protein